jgi:dCMP deaminase
LKHDKLVPKWREATCGACFKPYQTGNPKPCKDGVRRCQGCYKAWCNLKMLDFLYGITPEKYEAMFKAQGGVCAICKQPPPPGKRLAVDHDHKTGKVRGLLCILCNSTLGYFKDNITSVRAAVSYLLRHDGRRSWDNYFLDIAEATATRCKDESQQVGAVLVRDRQLLATGYNGFPAGVNDSVPERHERPAKYMWTVHAEINAILQAGKHGVSTAGASIYVTPLSPCLGCAKAIVQAGIKEIVCPEPGVLGKGDAAIELGQALELLAAAKVLIRRPD